MKKIFILLLPCFFNISLNGMHDTGEKILRDLLFTNSEQSSYNYLNSLPYQDFRSARESLDKTNIEFKASDYPYSKTNFATSSDAFFENAKIRRTWKPLVWLGALAATAFTVIYKNLHVHQDLELPEIVGIPLVFTCIHEKLIAQPASIMEEKARFLVRFGTLLQ